MKKSITMFLLSMVFCGFISACDKEGPAEKQGKKIDNAVEDVKDTLQDKGPAEKAGEKLDDATNND